MQATTAESTTCAGCGVSEHRHADGGCSIWTEVKVCDFPSAELLAYRKRIVYQADRETDPGRQRDIMNAVLKIDQLRILHEDIDGCNCFVRAVAAGA